jgi:hypothetical protein
VAAAGAIALLTALVVVALRAPVARASFTVSVSRTPVTTPLANDFLGLALEYNTIPEWVGSGRGAVNPPLVQLIRNLDPVGRPLVRVGGQSTDRSWWPVPGLPQPLGVTYTLTRAWTTAARSLAKALDAQLMLGLNLEANRTRIPEQEASHLLSGIGAAHVQSFQLGNEPELYLTTPWYRLLNGKPLPWFSTLGSRKYARAATYGPAAFMAEFTRTAAGLPRSVPLAGPETGSPLWMLVFAGLLSPHSRVRMLTFHGYGTSGCARDPANPAFPTIPHLLSPVASRSLLDGFQPYENAAHRDGASFRLDELGPVTCNGRPGVSDTMASALWATDTLFSLARAGLDGVNLHSYPNSANGLFDFTQTHGRWQAVVHPLYYGVLMFARAAPPGSRLLQVVTGNQDQVRAWATMGADRLVRVLVINDGLQNNTNVVVRPPIGYGSPSGSLQRLRASSAAARTGITLGGQQFGTTSTGALAPAVPQTVARQAGTYRIAVPPASAALLTLSHR